MFDVIQVFKRVGTMKKSISLCLVFNLWFSEFSFRLLSPVQTFASGTVTIADEGNLRAALVGGGLVTVACDGTILLNSTIAITNDTTLDAAGIPSPFREARPCGCSP